MWTGTALVNWLVSLGISDENLDPALRLDTTAEPFSHGVLLGRVGQNIPDKPDRIVIATPTAGAGRTDQRAIRRPGFQLRVRGPVRDLDSTAAEHMAYAFHELILGFPDSTHLPDGNYLLAVQQIGGEPAQVGPRGRGERAEFFSNYLTVVRA